MKEEEEDISSTSVTATATAATAVYVGGGNRTSEIYIKKGKNSTTHTCIPEKCNIIK